MRWLRALAKNCPASALVLASEKVTISIWASEDHFVIGYRTLENQLRDDEPNRPAGTTEQVEGCRHLVTAREWLLRDDRGVGRHVGGSKSVGKLEVSFAVRLLEDRRTYDPVCASAVNFERGKRFESCPADPTGLEPFRALISAAFAADISLLSRNGLQVQRPSKDFLFRRPDLSCTAVLAHSSD